MEKVLFILGPTAVGKTDISVALAKKFNGEIISCDSVQIFKGLNIGSAKITKEEMQGVKHHLIDIKDPSETFTAYEYATAIKEKIKEISSKGKLPIVVGGTSLYVKSIILNYNFGGVGINENLRKQLEEVLKTDGVSKLYEMLLKLDCELAEKVDKNNPLRLMRAIEIASEKGEKTKAESDIDSLVFALVKERNMLYEKINLRVDLMLKNGLVKEVENLKKQGLTKENQAMKAIGYKEVLDYLDGNISYEKMVDEIKQHSRNYAKRQLTFLRGMDNVNYVDAVDKEKAFNEICEKVEEWLKWKKQN
mgnify:FL=1